MYKLSFVRNFFQVNNYGKGAFRTWSKIYYGAFAKIVNPNVGGGRGVISPCNSVTLATVTVAVTLAFGSIQ